MALDPDAFRGMTPTQMLMALVADDLISRDAKARVAGAKCSRCMDTGMAGGVFCSCAAGGKIAYQGTRKDSPDDR